MNNYLSAMDDELKELKRNESSILYAMSTSACDKKAWQLFSEYVLGDECEEGLYFKYVKEEETSQVNLPEFIEKPYLKIYHKKK